MDKFISSPTKMKGTNIINNVEVNKASEISKELWKLYKSVLAFLWK